MNPISKYKYSIRDLIVDILLYIYLNEKGTFAKIQLLNIVKDHQIVSKSGPTAVSYDQWPLSNVFWMKFSNGHGKYKSEFTECFQMYWYWLNDAIFDGKSWLDISWQRLNHPNLLISCVFSCANNLHHLGIPLTCEDNFNKNKYPHIKSAYKSIFDDYGANADEMWINGNWFYVTKYDNFGDEGKFMQRSPPDNFTWWIMTQSTGFTRKGI